MITSEEVEKAAAFIRDNAAALAKAKGEASYLSEFRKSKKASLILEKHEGTVQERESYAYAHKDFLEVIEGLRAAEEEHERLKWMMIAAQAKIDIWRTQQANNRRIDSSHQ